MRRNKIIVSKSVKETGEIAKNFLDRLLGENGGNKRALVVGLSGELGAGKTAFTKAAAKHLGVKEKVNSPTFIIIKKYLIKKEKNFEFLFHIDAYRLKTEREIKHLGFREIIENKKHLVFIEWPENISKIMPKSAKIVRISHSKEGYRNFEL